MACKVLIGLTRNSILYLLLLLLPVLLPGQVQTTKLLTPYQTAKAVVYAMEKGDIAAITRLVHPVKGLLVGHVAYEIIGHDVPFTYAELKAASGNKPPVYKMKNGYDEEDKGKATTLETVLKDFSSCIVTKNGRTKTVLFSSVKDVKRNYTGNGSYSIYPPLTANQTVISFQVNDIPGEMEWEHLLIRTEKYKDKEYVVQIFRACWTP